VVLHVLSPTRAQDDRSLGRVSLCCVAMRDSINSERIWFPRVQHVAGFPVGVCVCLSDNQTERGGVGLIIRLSVLVRSSIEEEQRQFLKNASRATNAWKE